MTTQILQAKNGVISDELYIIAKNEAKDVEFIREKVANGRIVILKNKKRNIVPVGVGEGLRVKVNANIGVSKDKNQIDKEIDKVRVVQEAGADVLMDLSRGAFIDETRDAILQASKIPVGTVPIYQTFKDVLDFENNITKLSKDKLLSDIEKQCNDGVDFITLHCGITKFVIEQLEKQKRFSSITSHAGSIHACAIKMTRKENPLYENFDELLDLIKQYDVVLSLGCALRSGYILDSFDRAQIAEIIILGELAKKANEAGVQVMVEGIGHTPLNKIPTVISSIKDLTGYIPIHLVDTLACDCAIGHDNISSAIATSFACLNGADFIGVPLTDDNSKLRDGIISAKISAHCADLANQNKSAIERNIDFINAMQENNLNKIKEKAIDRAVFDRVNLLNNKNDCSMCGEYCSMNLYKKCFKQ